MNGKYEQFDGRLQELLDIVARFRYKDRMRHRRAIARAMPQLSIDAGEESSGMDPCKGPGVRALNPGLGVGRTGL